MAVAWDPAYETGHSGIDLQHRQLLEIVNELESSDHDTHVSRDVVLRVLDHMMEFAITHFMMEEDLMVHVQYPSIARDEMIARHEDFVAHARQRVLEFRKGELVDVLPLQAFLVDWLRVHEFGLDKRLADFIRDRAAAAEGAH